MSETTDAIVEAMALAMVNRAQERIDLPRIDSIADFRCEADCAEFLADARTALAAALPMLLVDVERAHSSAQYDPAPYTKGKAAIRARFDALAKEIGQ